MQVGNKNLENYELLEQLGKGSFGTVWKARRKDNSKIIALKSVKIRDEATRMAAFKEVELLKNISSPSCFPYIVCYYDSFFTDDKTLYIEMEYIDGVTLNEFAKDYRDRGDEKLNNYLLAIMTDLLPALSYLHSHGIIHRDIKPDNIMIDRQNNPKLIDIGVACFSNMCQTQECCIGGAGTPNFMPPETLLEKVSYQVSDIWGLGASIYFASTGKNLFYPKRPNLINLKIEVAEKPVPRLKSSNEKLNTIVNLMLTKNPFQRINTNEVFILLKE